MAPSVNTNTDITVSTDLEFTEHGVLEHVQQGDLMAWLYECAASRDDHVVFMQRACRQLSGMQRRGQITGFVTAQAGGQLLPMVSHVKIVASITSAMA